jgi:glucose-6-phosphate isomerase
MTSRAVALSRRLNPILLEKLTPAVLDKLVALYEYSVFTQRTTLGGRFI